MTTGRINQITLMRALQLSRFLKNVFEVRQGCGATRPARELSSTGQPVFYSRFCPQGEFSKRASDSKSLPMQEFHNCQLPHGSKASRLLCNEATRGRRQAALMLLPFQSTDPEQRVNWQSRLPRSQVDRAHVSLTPQDSIGSPILDG